MSCGVKGVRAEMIHVKKKKKYKKKKLSADELTSIRDRTRTVLTKNTRFLPTTKRIGTVFYCVRRFAIFTQSFDFENNIIIDVSVPKERKLHIWLKRHLST